MSMATRDRRSGQGVLHRVFVVGLWGKAIDGVLELIGGVLLVLIPPATLN